MKKLMSAACIIFIAMTVSANSPAKLKMFDGKEKQQKQEEKKKKAKVKKYDTQEGAPKAMDKKNISRGNSQSTLKRDMRELHEEKGEKKAVQSPK